MMYDIVFAIFLRRIQVVTLETTISLFTAAMIKRKARSCNAAAQTILNIRIVRATIGARADGRSAVYLRHFCKFGGHNSQTRTYHESSHERKFRRNVVLLVSIWPTTSTSYTAWPCKAS